MCSTAGCCHCVQFPKILCRLRVVSADSVLQVAARGSIIATHQLHWRQRLSDPAGRNPNDKAQRVWVKKSSIYIKRYGLCLEAPSLELSKKTQVHKIIKCWYCFSPWSVAPIFSPCRQRTLHLKISFICLLNSWSHNYSFIWFCLLATNFLMILILMIYWVFWCHGSHENHR